jgi:hypothetical protein
MSKFSKSPLRVLVDEKPEKQQGTPQKLQVGVLKGDKVTTVNKGTRDAKDEKILGHFDEKTGKITPW